MSDIQTFIKYKKHHDKVLKFIKEKFPYQDYEAMSDSEGILHGYVIHDTSSGEQVTVGWDNIFHQVMYMRTCQPLMFCASVGEVKEINK